MLVWRSGLCDWCRGCMQMHRAVSMLVRGTVKRLVFTKDQYSTRCSSSLYLKPYHESSALGGPLCRWPCNHRWIAWGMCQEALDLERSNGEERTESKCRKDKDHDLQYRTGPPAEQVFPCAVCHTEVGSNSIFCNGCKHWVHKKCSGLKRLKKDPDYRCTRCQGTARPLDGRPQKEVQVGPDKLEVVASFCYLGDMLSAAGGCELSTTTRVKTACKKFKDLLPVLSSHHFSFKTCGGVYSSCVRSAMLHASETWPLTKPNLQRLQRNDRAMIRQICNVRLQDIVTTRLNELLVRLGIEDLDLILKERRLQWYGPVECSNGAVKTAFDIQVDGTRGPGRPKMTWKQLTERDCREWKLSAINPHDRRTWRSGVRSAMRAASQLSGRGPLMWMLPMYLHVNQKSDYDMMIWNNKDLDIVVVVFLFIKIYIVGHSAGPSCS